MLEAAASRCSRARKRVARVGAGTDVERAWRGRSSRTWTGCPRHLSWGGRVEFKARAGFSRRRSALVFSAAGFSTHSGSRRLMGPYVDSVTSDEILPPSTGVCIIGGGIIGTSAALALASRGIPVVLCEKGYIACEQSSRNWGWCRQAGRDEREMPLIIESLRLWRDLNRLTESETGFRTCGVMYVGETEEDEKRFAGWLDMARPYD